MNQSNAMNRLVKSFIMVPGDISSAIDRRLALSFMVKMRCWLGGSSASAPCVRQDHRAKIDQKERMKNENINRRPA